MALNATTQAMPVINRNNVSECSRKNSRIGEGSLPFGCWLSADPFSYRCLVMKTVTRTPVQSAIAFPKNDPQWVEGFDRQYSTTNKPTMPNAARPRECLLMNDFGARLCFMQILYVKESRSEPFLKCRRARCGTSKNRQIPNLCGRRLQQRIGLRSRDVP